MSTAHPTCSDGVLVDHTVDVRSTVDRLTEASGGVMAQSGVPPMAARVLARVLVSDSGVLTCAEPVDFFDFVQEDMRGLITRWHERRRRDSR
jgi:hypothetical protein